VETRQDLHAIVAVSRLFRQIISLSASFCAACFCSPNGGSAKEPYTEVKASAGTALPTISRMPIVSRDQLGALPEQRGTRTTAAC